MNPNARLYVDIHLLQTMPPSCVNRDDTGSPKTAIYGGAMRARVSSQCWKRAMRLMFRDIYPTGSHTYRTKRIVSLVADKLARLGYEGDQEKKAMDLLNLAGLKIKNAKKGTDALFFLSDAQVEALAGLAMAEEEPDRKAAQAALNAQPGMDIALFGRMVADDPSLNTDACAQVAHAISTHAVFNEYDYFTAVDDLAPEDNSGAGHIGAIAFNASTLYRYATVAAHQLYRLLKEETPAAIRAFVEAFVRSMPTGKQNTFANHTMPDAVLVTLRRDQPLNLVGAFEKPVYAKGEGYVEASTQRLVQHAKQCYGDFAMEPAASFVTGGALSGLAAPMPFPALLDTLYDALAKELAGEGQ